ncbi:ACP7 [Symbiodinium microadriaticum]|nr:ACP7 [Symbiodinium microadriaticum]
MVGVGNHEKFYNYTSFNARYKMPAEASRGNQNFWYSYDYGNIHWISISSEHSLDPDSEQMRFLRSDLEMASANRQAIPWIVMSLHRPIYCSSWNSFDDTRPGSKYQSALEPLLLEFDVDLTVTGHMHLVSTWDCNEKLLTE